jgi:hypothetical protein
MNLKILPKYFFLMLILQASMYVFLLSFLIMYSLTYTFTHFLIIHVFIFIISTFYIYFSFC